MFTRAKTLPAAALMTAAPSFAGGNLLYLLRIDNTFQDEELANIAAAAIK